MRILFNTYPVAFACPGGGEIQLMKTKEALIKFGHPVTLYDLWNPQLEKADVVHYFSVQGGSYNFCQYVKNAGIPLVISPILWPKGDISKYPMNEIKELHRLADLLFPNSHAEAKLLSEVFDIPLQKFHVTFNGVDDIFAKDDEVSGELFRDHYKIHSPFILCVANIEERKNQITLVRALEKINTTLVLIGNIRDKSYYERIQKISRTNILYIGYLPHDSILLRSAYTACDLFILPSYLETPGLAALEAAAMGAKIVITQEGSTEEYFRDFVTYVDPESIDSIHSGIEIEIQAKRSGLLQEHVRKNFRWFNTAKQALSGYQKILKT